MRGDSAGLDKVVPKSDDMTESISTDGYDGASLIVPEDDMLIVHDQAGAGVPGEQSDPATGGDIDFVGSTHDVEAPEMFELLSDHDVPQSQQNAEIDELLSTLDQIFEGFEPAQLEIAEGANFLTPAGGAESMGFETTMVTILVADDTSDPFVA